LKYARIFFTLLIIFATLKLAFGIENSRVNNSMNTNEQDILYLQKYKSELKLIQNTQSIDNIQNKDVSIENKDTDISPIEKLYNLRIENGKIKLKQFGYKIFENYKVYNIGSVGDEYILGPNDSIFLYLWGDPIDILKLQGFYSLKIDREGKIYIPHLGVFYVWGLSIKEVKNLLYDEFAKKFKNFKLELSLGKIREFPIYVSGYVNNPGVILVNSTLSIIDALALAGGVSKNGSLREIILTRNNGNEIKIDLYELLIKGKPIKVRLKEGDTIYVNPIGKTSAIYGSVKRPAIYELKDGEDNIKTLIDLAGGFLANIYAYNIKIYRYENNNLKILEGTLDNKEFLNSKLLDGDCIKTEKIPQIVENAVTIEGYIKYPGNYSVETTQTLRDAILKANPYVDTNLYYGEIIRKEEGKPPIYMTFSPQDVIDGKYNLKLKPLDTIRFYKFGDVKSVDFNKFENSIVLKGAIKYPGVYAYKPNMKLSDVFDSKQLLIDTNLYYAEIVRREENNNTYTYKVINFKPQDILNKKKDIKLKPMDIVYFYPDKIYAPIRIGGKIKEAKLIPYYEGIKLLDVLKEVNFNINPKYLKAIITRKIPKKERENILADENIKNIDRLEKYRDENIKDIDRLTKYRDENIKYIDRLEKYRDEDIKDIDRLEKYNDENIKDIDEEFIQQSFQIYLLDLLVKGDEKYNIDLNPGDSILIKEIENEEKGKTVKILGEVNRPGVYEYKPGMTLYDLIIKAGGYTEDAYPKGLIFIRESAKKLQQQQLEATILTMEEELSQSSESLEAVGATPQEQALAKMAIEKQKKLLEIVKKKAKVGLGRIALDIPDSLEKLKNSSDNIELQDGDFIYIPAKPNYILVLGGVYNQISLPYRKGKTIKWYLKEVGGLKDYAKKDDIYIIKANGRVISQRNYENFAFYWDDNKLNFGKDFYSLQLEQGDAIVVPTEMKIPILWRPLIKDITQIIFQALSTAVLASRL